MKEWRDIPEYKEIFDRICEESLIVEKDPRTIPREQWVEFDPELEKIHKRWREELFGFCDRYRKEHPEEFDENGKFKQDS